METDMTNRTLADRYFDIDAQIKALEATKDALKAEIVALGVELIEGAEVDVKVSLSQRSVLDEALLLETYGVTPEQMKLYNACKKDGKTFEVLKVVPKKGKE
jgi:hypothetical protein